MIQRGQALATVVTGSADGGAGLVSERTDRVVDLSTLEWMNRTIHR